MEAYDPKLHGEDMDLYRSAYALGYRHQDYLEPTTPKHFMDALQVGYISKRHKAMGGPVMYLKAICAGFHPDLDGSPKVFLKQHAKGNLPPGSRWSSPITPQEFREQMVVDVCPLPVNAGAKLDSLGMVTHHFVAPSGPEFDAEAMGLTVDLTGAPDSDDDMDSVEVAEAKAIDGPSTEDAPEDEASPDQYGHTGTQFQPLDSYPALPFDVEQAYPLTGGPVFLATELEYLDDPLKPGLGTSNYNPSFECPDARIKTDFLNGHHCTVAPGLVALLPPNLQASAQQPISDAELLAFDQLREQLHKTQVTLATLILCARPNYSQIEFMNWYGLPMQTWIRYTAQLMHHNVDEAQVQKLIKMEEYFDMIVFLSRLAHTPPEVLFPQLENRGAYTKAYDLSIAWPGVTSVWSSVLPNSSGHGR